MTQQFGKFQLLKKIATGGMAEIYIARQRGMEGFEKIVVIKTILPNLASNEEFVQMFLDEARIAARLTHPNIVQIFDLGRVGTTYFIAMEYIQGENLRAVAKKCRKAKAVIPLEHVVKVISNACEGLHYAHSKTDTSGRPMNIVHRDISPQNILVSFEGIVKLVDFVIAKAATQYQETRAGILKGKYSYMSPEQCMSKPIDARSDIFSMGILLWELSTGLRLFKMNSELMILKEITEGKVRPPREINQRIPAELEAIILKALEKNPDHRFQNAIEMHMALEEFMKNQHLTSSSVHLAAFMSELFKDKLASLRKIEETVSEGENLESFLFDDMNETDGMYVPGTGMTPSSASPITTPSEPLYPKATTGISRIAPPPVPGPDPSSKRGVLIGSLIVVLLAVLGTLGYFIFSQLYGKGDKPVSQDAGIALRLTNGNIHITSTPSGATVFVDGNKKGTSPCDVKDLKLGTFYTLRLSKPGQRPWTTQFKLEDSSVRRFHARLEPAGPGAWGTVEVITTPRGAKITLDGKTIKETTPLTIKKVTAKTNHTIVASLEGHKDWTKTFKLQPKQRLKLRGELAVKRPVDSDKKKRAYFSLRSRPRGARFFLNGSSVGGSFSLDPGGSYVITARLSGYREWRNTITPKPGARRTITANLVRKSGSTVVTSGKAKLSLNCTPWATVFVDNVKIGTTPIANHEISAGPHTIRLVNNQIKAKKTIKIKAKPGELVRKNVEFAKGFLQVRAKPWAHVFVQGNKIGTTPFQPKQMYEGTYTVVMKNPTLNLSIEKTAVIKKGQTTILKVNFLE